MFKLHLIDLLSICYTANFATNTVTNRTDEVYALVYMAAASTVEGETTSCPSTILLISPITACRDEIFFKSTVAHTKMGHVSKTTPL